MARILIIAADGTSAGHLDYALNRMREEGYDVTVAAPVKKPLHTVVHEMEEGLSSYVERPGYIMNVDASLDEIDPAKFAALLLPGGRAPEYLRNIERCIEIVRHFVEYEKPIGSICHSPLILAAAVKGRRLTGVDYIKPDIIASGNTWVETRSEAVRDGNIVTTWVTPFYYVWIREFLSMLNEHGIKPSRANRDQQWSSEGLDTALAMGSAK
jgi:PfpI family intracellular protease